MLAAINIALRIELSPLIGSTKSRLVRYTVLWRQRHQNPIADAGAQGHIWPMKHKSAMYALLFSGPSPRVALLGIYSIDLRQDIASSLEHESLRKYLLTWLRENFDSSSIGIWGMTRNG